MTKSDEPHCEGETPPTEDTAKEKLPYDPKKTYTYEEAEKIGRAGVPLGVFKREPLSPQDRLRLAELAAVERLSRLAILADDTKIGGDGCACTRPHRRRSRHNR